MEELTDRDLTEEDVAQLVKELHWAVGNGSKFIKDHYLIFLIRASIEIVSRRHGIKLTSKQIEDYLELDKITEPIKE